MNRVRDILVTALFVFLGLTAIEGIRDIHAQVAQPAVSTGLSGVAQPCCTVQEFHNNAVTTATNVKTNNGNYYGFAIANPNGSVCWLQVFNALAANVTLGTTAPLMSIPMASSATSSESNPYPVNFNTAISIAATTTATGGSTCATGLGVELFYQ